MSYLIKYEFRKCLLSKLILLGVTAFLQVLFLTGIYADKDVPLGIGMVGLFFIALVGIFYIGIESILILYKDITTRQSYMLFMTPNSSYKILGAKALENAFSVMLSGLFYSALGSLDLWLLFSKFGSIQDFLNLFQNIMVNFDSRLELSSRSVFTLLFMVLCSWLMEIVTGYLAVVLSCTILSGRKGSGIISFLVYIAISFLLSWIVNACIPDSLDILTTYLIYSAASLAFTVVMYFITAWIMDRKLSV